MECFFFLLLYFFGSHLERTNRNAVGRANLPLTNDHYERIQMRSVLAKLVTVVQTRDDHRFN